MVLFWNSFLILYKHRTDISEIRVSYMLYYIEQDFFIKKGFTSFFNHSRNAVWHDILPEDLAINIDPIQPLFTAK